MSDTHQQPETDAAEPSGSPVSGELLGTPRSGAEPPSSSSSDTSLDTLESSVKNSPVALFLAAEGLPINAVETLDTESYAARFRHSCWMPIRRKIFASLDRCNVPASRLGAFATCGSSSFLYRNDEDNTRWRIQANHCHDRLCTPCANLRSMRLKEALMSMMDSRPLTFITLTLSGKDQGLSELIDRLYTHFRALRRHPLWEEAVQGGAAFLEIKFNDKSNRWHPHLHIICHAKFMKQDELSMAWRSITRDSWIVDIRRVKDQAASARYVTKYASKPLNMSFANSPELLDQAVVALKGRRLCLCFGTWYGTPLDLADEATLADDPIDAGSWSSMFPLEDALHNFHRDVYMREALLAAGITYDRMIAATSTPPPT